MTLLTDSNNSVGIYVPSCNRSENVHDRKLLPNSRFSYVVRKSQEKLYLSEGCVNVIAVEDEEINSLGKVRQWIIDNAKEDVVIQVDDDVKSLRYVLKENTRELTDDEVVGELLRVSQIILDLDLGFASTAMNPDPRRANSEFVWKEITGGICWFNKKALKARYERELMKVDADFMLQELLYNRICVVPKYLGLMAEHDVNKGGNNVNKTYARLVSDNEYLKTKWGRHYGFDYKSNKTKINVKR